MQRGGSPRIAGLCWRICAGCGDSAAGGGGRGGRRSLFYSVCNTCTEMIGSVSGQNTMVDSFFIHTYCVHVYVPVS